jgi:hypothetical protein
MPFDIVITFGAPVELTDLFEACGQAFPDCVCGDIPRNSPATNPIWDRMPEVIKDALSKMPDQAGMSCERADGSIDLIATKPGPISDLIGEIRGRYDWSEELSLLCRLLNGVATASVDGSVYAPTKEDS